MKFRFRELPAAGSVATRPVVDVWLEGLEVTGLGCLLDTGAMHTRFSADIAEIAGIGFEAEETSRFAVAGRIVEGRPARVGLSLRDAVQRHDWDAIVWFCDPWPFDFQLLGLQGFLRHFRVTVSAYHEWVDCAPETDEPFLEPAGRHQLP